MDQGRLERDIAALQKAGAIGQNLDCLVILVLAAVLALGGVVSVFAGGLPGIILFVATIAVGVVAWVTKLGEGIMIGVVGVLSLAAGIASVLAAVFSAIS